jgi:hypothetical protein
MDHRFAPVAVLALFAVGVAAAQTPVDGTWKTGDSPPERVTFRVASGSVSMSASTGTGYTAKLDGPQAPLTGEKEPRMVTVKMPAPNVLEETTYKSHKAILRFRMEVAPGGKTAHVTWKSLVSGKSGAYSMTRE